MDSIKDKGSRNGSKANLNESNVPLLEDEIEKDKIELKERASTNSKEEDEKDDSKTEKQEDAQTTDATQPEVETAANGGKDKKQKKKEKKEKKPKEEPQGPSGITKLSIGLNVLDRDDKHNNDDVNIQFDDVICEPDSSQSFEGIWRLTFIIFSATKLWCYRLLSAIVALPCAIFCGLNFAILTCLFVWVITPIMRCFQINIRFLQRFWSLFFRAIFDPIFQSIGQVFSSINVQRQTV